MIKSILLKFKEQRSIKLLSLVFLAIFVFVFVIAVIKSLPVFDRDTDEKNAQIYEADREGFAIINDELSEILSSNDKEYLNRENILCDYSIGSKLYLRDNEYYIETKESSIRIASAYPLFTDNGAHLYLYHGGFTFLNEDLSLLQGKEGSYISDGMVFNKDKQREGNESLILLNLPTGLSLSLQEFTIEIWDELVVIPMHSIIQWSSDRITYYNAYKEEQLINTLELSDRTAMINYCGKRSSYTTFFERQSNPGEESNRIEELTVEDELYQYHMSNKYVYSGNKVFFRVRDGYCMETTEGRHILSGEPLYRMGDDDKILLPKDYLLVQPKLYLMNRLSALSELTKDEHGVYVAYGDKQHTYTDLFLFDGNNTYIFFDYLELSWKDESYRVTPFSYVSVDESGLIEIYDYESKKYLTYIAEGYQGINILLEGNIILDLGKNIMYRPDGQEFILFKDPSLLEEAE